MPHENVPPLVFKNQLGYFANPDRSYRDEPQGAEQVTNPESGRTFQRGERVCAFIHRCLQRDGDGRFNRWVEPIRGVIARISPSTEMAYIHDEPGKKGRCIGIAHPDELFPA